MNSNSNIADITAAPSINTVDRFILHVSSEHAISIIPLLQYSISFSQNTVDHTPFKPFATLFSMSFPLSWAVSILDRKRSCCLQLRETKSATGRSPDHQKNFTLLATVVDDGHLATSNVPLPVSRYPELSEPWLSEERVSSCTADCAFLLPGSKSSRQSAELQIMAMKKV